ncbi:uncharacterized protein EAF02_004017 [Botrytis sinoallii]|uniref:uncharacterized protein n=1 Tax=Botrytis sinoallii TaxID=1463999 RepID=UPI00190054B6|nr:uncharacterized protein EAF02_004017 [Botrytis sinoallii]KAF7885508.1 hypothetical protein EAF02_004017 [Botrytis sinoallii]
MFWVSRIELTILGRLCYTNGYFSSRSLLVDELSRLSGLGAYPAFQAEDTVLRHLVDLYHGLPISNEKLSSSKFGKDKNVLNLLSRSRATKQSDSYEMEMKREIHRLLDSMYDATPSQYIKREFFMKEFLAIGSYKEIQDLILADLSLIRYSQWRDMSNF